MKVAPLWLGAVRYEGPRFRLSEARGGPGDPPLAVKLPHLDHSFGEDRESLLDELNLCRTLPEGICLKPRGPAGVDLPGATVWEWVEGQPLSELLGAPMRPASAVRALLSLCGPLGDLHDQQIVLDDLRPDALWLDRVRGTALFLDLSAARSAGPGHRGGQRSLEERRLEILAPEQSGLVALSVDHRADLYALGALFYWMLAGRPPFAAQDRSGLVHAHMTATPEPLAARCPGLPLALSEIAGRLLEKNPGARYQSALGLAADLRECLDQLQIDGQVEPFPLGQHDASPVLRLPRGLFGRDDAIAELRAAALDPAVSAVAVAGPSGIGKSSLVAAALAGSGARVATSKLDLVAGRAPLSALREALRPLVDRLLGGDPDALNSWLARLNADDLLAASLVELLPSLAPVLAAQPPAVVLSALEARRRLHLAARALLSSQMDENAALALFVDDLQWADEASLDLLEGLMTGDAVPGLTLILAWRDNEVDGRHPVGQLLDRVQRAGRPPRRVAVGPLDAQGLGGVVGAMLGAPPDSLVELSTIVCEKSGGNPYFAQEFLRRLVSDGDLSFRSREGGWRWDAERLRARQVTANVRDLVAARIAELPPEQADLLSAAACIGHSFDLDVVAAATGVSRDAMARDLRRLRLGGFLVPDDGNGHERFIHDGVQEAARARLAPERRRALHRAIGLHLLGPDREIPADDALFTITAHLSELQGDALDPSLRALRLRLEQAAAGRAMATAAFERADLHLAAALSLLDPATRAADPELAAAIEVDAARCAATLGRKAESDAHFDAALAAIADPVARARVHQLRSRVLTQHDHNEQALESCLAGLGALDRGISARPGPLAVLAELVPALMRMAWARRRGLDHLPPMTDPRRLAEMGLLADVTLTAMRLARPPLDALVTLRMVNLWLAHGQTPEAAVAYAKFGLISSLLFGAPRMGHDMGAEAFSMARRDGDPTVLGRVMVFYGGFLRHLRKPLRETTTMLEEAVRSAMRAGDVLYASVALGGALSYLPLDGHSLDEAHGQARRGLDFFRYTRNWAGVSRQITRVCAALGGAERFPEPPPEPDDVEVPDDDGWSDTLGWVYDVAIGCFLGDAAASLAAADKVLANPMVIRLSDSYKQYFWSMYPLALCEAVRAGQLPRRRLRAARRARRYLDRARQRAPANAEHRYQLVHAELLVCDGRPLEAMAAYDAAIAAAEAGGYHQDAGLAAERAARFHRAAGRGELAELYRQRALRHFEAWGADRVVERLMAGHGPTRTQSGSPAPRARGGLDLDAVLKATRALSGEVVLGELLTKLCLSLAEIAGAERVFVLLPAAGGLRVEAAWDSQRGAAPAVRSGAVGDHPDLCPAIVRYVHRTQQPLLLADALADPTWQADPDVRRRQLRSILCLPLSRQGAPSGLLYLENNLLAGVFTEARLGLLDIVGAQAAISIENARLYETLEQRVQERAAALRGAMGELEAAQSQVLLQEKLASLGRLSASVAHEIRNPLHFIQNYAGLNIQLADELRATLAALPDSPEGQALRDTAETLSANAARIRDHSLRADQIVHDMQFHAARRDGDEAPAPLNDLVAAHSRLAAAAETALPEDCLALHLDPALAEHRVPEASLGRVLVNLVKNACDAVLARATREPGFMPSIRVSTQAVGVGARVRVQDNGGGVDEALLSRVFEPFFTTKAPGQGTGLGLSLSRDIVVRGHGGDLLLENHPGEGCTFVLALPRPSQGAWGAADSGPG